MNWHFSPIYFSNAQSFQYSLCSVMCLHDSGHSVHIIFFTLRVSKECISFGKDKERRSPAHRPADFLMHQTECRYKRAHLTKHHFDGEARVANHSCAEFKMSLAFSFVLIFPAGSKATETRCQSAETEHVLKVGVFPKGKLPQE